MLHAYVRNAHEMRSVSIASDSIDLCLCFCTLSFILFHFSSDYNFWLHRRKQKKVLSYFIGDIFLFHIRFMRGSIAIKFGRQFKVHVTCTNEHTNQRLSLSLSLSPSLCAACMYRCCCILETTKVKSNYIKRILIYAFSVLVEKKESVVSWILLSAMNGESLSLVTQI